jgi:hypothetical protein
MPDRTAHLNLNFSEVFVERLRRYASLNGMKINAVLKQAFEMLEDHPELVVRKKSLDDAW